MAHGIRITKGRKRRVQRTQGKCSNGLSSLPLWCMALATGNVNWRLWNKLEPSQNTAVIKLS